MKPLLKFLNSIGLFDRNRISDTVPSDVYEYPDPSGVKKSEAHMHYLKSLLDEEAGRLNLIEGKTSQLIGQTGLIFSLLSLFVPLLVDKINDISLVTKVCLLIVLLFAFGFYLLTIRNALKNYNVKTFKYSSPSPKNVQTFRDQELNAFYSEVVRDLLYSLHRNNEINNAKATNLLRSYNSFRLANWATGILVISFCMVLMFLNQKKPVVVHDTVKVEHLDSLIKTTIMSNMTTKKKYRKKWESSTCKALKRT